MSASAGAREIPVGAQLMQLLAGKWISRAISAAADLGVADYLAAGPRTTEELADACGAHEPSLYRLLRALASIGMFEEAEPRRFALTALADPLRSDSPSSMRNMARWIGSPMAQRAWEPLTDTVRTGETGLELLELGSVFDYFDAHREEAAVFNAAMTDFSRQSAPAVAEAYDFSRFRKLVDIAGGHGMLLRTILERHPRVRGVLFDLPRVIEGARAAGLPPRCETASGDFFRAVPRGADGYLMKHIVHDWDDDRAAEILANVRKAITAAGRLLVVEMVVPDGNEPSLGKLLDLEMLALVSGRERTEAEFRRLFAAAGFELLGVTPTRSPVSIVEGRPV